MAAPEDTATVRVRCERMVAGGDSLARRDDGRIVFVSGAAAGEVVDVELAALRSGVARGVVTRVVEPSSDRVEPPCAQVGRGCGGCDWQHLSVEAQRVARRGIVRESLERLGRLDPDTVARAMSAVPDRSPLPSRGVRTTVRLALDAEGRPGFRAARSHDVVVTRHCLVAHPAIADLVPTVLLPGASEVSIRVGAATGERGMWWTPPEVTPRFRVPDDVRTGPGAVVHETVAGVTLRVSAESFFQPSLEAAEAIVAAVRHAAEEPLAGLRPDDLVIDAYGGVGLLAATVVPPDRSVLVVEGSRTACADAEANLAHRRARVLRCSVERWRAEPAGLVIADPSRSGLGAEACRRLLAAEPDDVVLVSCDPASLGRDAALLEAQGFRLATCEVIDSFPHTHHVEAVSRFTRRR